MSEDERGMGRKVVIVVARNCFRLAGECTIVFHVVEMVGVVLAVTRHRKGSGDGLSTIIAIISYICHRAKTTVFARVLFCCPLNLGDL